MPFLLKGELQRIEAIAKFPHLCFIQAATEALPVAEAVSYFLKLSAAIIDPRLCHLALCNLILNRSLIYLVRMTILSIIHRSARLRAVDLLENLTKFCITFSLRIWRWWLWRRRLW